MSVRNAKVLFVHKRERQTIVCLENIDAFNDFGGAPRTIVPDNLKAAVIRAAFGSSEPCELQRSYRELARFYGFMVDPTPPRSPEKKGKVESAVK